MRQSQEANEQATDTLGATKTKKERKESVQKLGEHTIIIRTQTSTYSH